MSSPSATEPDMWLNEEAAEHDNEILVQAQEIEGNNTKWEVEFGNGGKKIGQMFYCRMCAVFIISHVTVIQCQWKAYRLSEGTERWVSLLRKGFTLLSDLKLLELIKW